MRPTIRTATAATCWRLRQSDASSCAWYDPVEMARALQQARLRLILSEGATADWAPEIRCVEPREGREAMNALHQTPLRKVVNSSAHAACWRSCGNYCIGSARATRRRSYSFRPRSRGLLHRSQGWSDRASKLKLYFGLRNMGIAPAGSDRENSGHHHLLIDTQLPPLDKPIPNDFNHLHFGAGQTEAEITLKPGEHTLQLLMGDKDHIPHSPRSCRNAFTCGSRGRPKPPA